MVLKAIVEFESTLQGHEACDLTVSPYRVCYLGGDSWGASFLPLAQRDDTLYSNVYWCSFTQRDGRTGAVYIRQRHDSNVYWYLALEVSNTIAEKHYETNTLSPKHKVFRFIFSGLII